MNYDPDKWPNGSEVFGQEMECDPIMGCQPISKATFARMLQPPSPAWHEAIECIWEIFDNLDHSG